MGRQPLSSKLWAERIYKLVITLILYGCSLPDLMLGAQ